METASNNPLLAPFTLGQLELRHRIVMDGSLDGCVPTPDGALDPSLVASYGARATQGGLLICPAAPIPNLLSASVSEVAWSLPGIRSASQVNAWLQVTRVIHARGGLAMVQLGATWGELLEGPDTDLDGVDAALMACRTAAENAADAGFDAIELRCIRGTVANRCATFVRDALSAVMAVWPASRVGICLTRPEDAVEYAATSALLTSTRDLGLTHAHLVAANRANDPTAGTTAARLRSEVPGALIVSGAWTPATALAAIESRAVDAVGVDGTFRLEDVG